MIEIPLSTPPSLECNLTGLFWWWWYDIQVGGYTKIGTGVTLNVAVQTDEEGWLLIHNMVSKIGQTEILSHLFICGRY